MQYLIGGKDLSAAVGLSLGATSCRVVYVDILCVHAAVDVQLLIITQKKQRETEPSCGPMRQAAEILAEELRLEAHTEKG